MSLRLPHILSLLVFASIASAQVVVTNVSNPYTQNFDTLTAPNTAPGGTSEGNGTASNWADNTANAGSLTINGVANSTRFGLVGWYAYAAVDRDVDFNTTIGGAGTVNRIWGNTGSSTGSRLYSYSVAGTNSVNDKAFGALAGASSGNYTIGLRLTNNTGANITEVSVAYTGEQWRTTAAAARTMIFGYQLGSPTDLNSGTWTGVSSLNFTSPILTGTGPQIDGNAPANRVSIASTAIGLSTPWAPGTDLWLRWVIPTAGGAQGLAVDDLTVSYTSTAIPAPTALVATPGAGQVGLSWTASAGAATYSIKRSTTSGSGYTTLSSGTVTGTTFVDTSGTVGVSYFYVVTAVSSGSLESANSNEVSASSQASAPAAPTALVATAGVSQIGLSWSASAGAATYSIKRSTTSGSGYTTLSSGVVTGTTYTDSSVVNGTPYFYVVSAVASGESPNSSEASATALTALQSWRQLKFGTTDNSGSAADNADPDADGRSNLIEYATGSEPLTADVGPATTLGQSAAPAKLTLTFTRIADPTLTYAVFATNDLLGTWTSIWSGTGVENTAGLVVAQDSVAISDQPRRFLRLQITP